MSQWREAITGARMLVDEAFVDEVDASTFSRQQWGLIMTAVTLRIHRPEEPSAATLYADTEALDGMMDDIQRVPELTPGGDADREDKGIIAAFLSALDVGGDDERRQELHTEAERLAEAYATDLQTYLEDEERWEEICAMAAEETDADT